MTHLLYIIRELAEWQTSHRKYDSSKLLITTLFVLKRRNVIAITDYEIGYFSLALNLIFGLMGNIGGDTLDWQR